ncbi:MAG TPA: dihydrolipoamide acetyltransferase family protein [Methylomirabilota bacterium]|nr:dihydrolipoamide acetyltransferase family protein [Methylomirabilota bacterium]
MAREFKLPDLGEGLTEAEIVQLLVAEGDEVKEDQPVLLVETEKAQVELPSPFGGRVSHIHVKPGQRVKVGSTLLSFEGGGAPAAARVRASAPQPARPVATPPPAGAPPAATPATRRLARELGVDLSTVKGSGPGGRITDEDVRAAAGRGPAPAKAEPARAPAPAEPGRPLELHRELPVLPRFEQWGPVERERLIGVRRRSAEHLALAWSVIPHVTQHDQADVTDLEGLRRRHHPRVKERGGDLTLTVLLVKAAAIVLQAHPRFNASLDHQTGELVKKRYYHIGVAVDTPQGLVVPVVRDADRKRVRELAAELPQLVARTRDGKATLEDLRGGTFTITNTGALGGTGATPIINYPEVAILGVGRAREMPVVRDGQVVIRLILPLSLAFDHRVIDGMEAARFAADLVRLLEDPERLLLEG